LFLEASKREKQIQASEHAVNYLVASAGVLVARTSALRLGMRLSGYEHVKVREERVNAALGVNPQF